jgi:hypothetical protein
MNASDVLALIKSRSKRRHYVYVLLRPDESPFYVGVGTGRRILDHAIFARRPELDSHKLRVIRKLWRLGRDIDYAIHAFFDNRSEAESAEAVLISKLGRRDLRTGPLSNVTAGGEGAPSPSNASLSARSLSLKATWAQRDRKAATAHLNNIEVRARAAASRIGKKREPYKPRDPKWVTDEFRAKQRALMLANPLSRRPGVVAKMSATKLGKRVPNHWTKDPAHKSRITRGAHPRARQIEIGGRKFACKQDAVDQIPVALSTLDYWLKRGSHGARFL